MPTVDYIKGRLHGLDELVKILKDVVASKSTDNAAIIQVLTSHISNQLDSILQDVEGMPKEKPEHEQVAQSMAQKHEESKSKVEAAETPEDKVEEHSKTVDDLLKDLENMKGN
jgi:methyl-accepting chemotaxis protein